MSHTLDLLIEARPLFVYLIGIIVDFYCFYKISTEMEDNPINNFFRSTAFALGLLNAIRLVIYLCNLPIG